MFWFLFHLLQSAGSKRNKLIYFMREVSFCVGYGGRGLARLRIKLCGNLWARSRPIGKQNVSDLPAESESAWLLVLKTHGLIICTDTKAFVGFFKIDLQENFPTLICHPTRRKCIYLQTGGCWPGGGGGGVAQYLYETQILPQKVPDFKNIKY